MYPFPLYFGISASCSKPIIGNGMVSPDRMAIDSGATYSVTCDATFEISGSPTINCEGGNQLSELPTCEPGQSIIQRYLFISQ